MTAIPDVQRAWIAVRRGKPVKALVLQEEWPVLKKLKDGEILVKVEAAALNPVWVSSRISDLYCLKDTCRGWKMMRVLPNVLARRPHIAEHDFSGVVVDANGTNLNYGDDV